MADSRVHQIHPQPVELPGEQTRVLPAVERNSLLPSPLRPYPPGSSDLLPTLKTAKAHRDSNLLRRMKRPKKTKSPAKPLQNVGNRSGDVLSRIKRLKKVKSLARPLQNVVMVVEIVERKRLSRMLRREVEACHSTPGTTL